MSGADRNYGIIIKALPDWREHNIIHCGLSGNKDAIERVEHRKELSMFPREVEFVQYSDEIVRSFVGLEIFDSSLIGSGKPLYFFSSRVHQVVEGMGVIPDGEISVGWTCSAIALGKCNGEQIKAASDAVDNDPASALIIAGIPFTLLRRMIFLPGCEFRSPTRL